jgi:hypothetical protein
MFWLLIYVVVKGGGKRGGGNLENLRRGFWNPPTGRDLRAVYRNSVSGLVWYCNDHAIGVDACPDAGVDFILGSRADVECIAGWRVNAWPCSAELGSGKKPRTDRGVKISMVGGEAVQEAAPYCPRCFIWTFLMNFP